MLLRLLWLLELRMRLLLLGLLLLLLLLPLLLLLEAVSMPLVRRANAGSVFQLLAGTLLQLGSWLRRRAHAVGQLCS